MHTESVHFVINCGMAAADTKTLRDVLRKVKNYPEYADKTEDERTQLARELCDHEKLFKRFSYLIPSDEEARRVATRDKMAFVHSVEKEKDHQRAKHEMARNCHLPVKIFFSRLQQVDQSRKYVSSKLYEMFFSFGILHAGLLVGDVRVEWGKESLVVPQWEDPALIDEDFSANVHQQGNYALSVARLNKKFSLADRERRVEDMIGLVLESTKEKRQLIMNLVDVIAKYNRTKRYNLLTCNCQHFVIEAMKALGIEEPPKFSGKLSNYLQQLRDFKVHIPDEFDSHDSLDDYVKQKLPTNTLTQHDMEYLLLHYHRIHVNSIPDDAVDEWECPVLSCQYESLADKVKRQAMVCHQFLTQHAHKPVRERRVRPTTLRAISEESAILSPTNGHSDGKVSKQIVYIVVYILRAKFDVFTCVHN